MVRWFALGITALLTFIVASCGHDASLNITKIDTKRIFIDVVSEQPLPEGESVFVLNSGRGVELNRTGRTELDVPSGSAYHLDATLPKGWEVVSWKVFPDAHVAERSSPSIDFPAVQADQHITLKIQPIPFLKFAVKVSGKGYSNKGGGSVNWFVWPPKTKDISSEFYGDSGWCNTINGFSKEAPRTCDNSKSERFPKGYPNGSIVVIEVQSFPEGNFWNGVTKRLEPIVLKDHHTFTHDFEAALEKSESAK